MYPLFKFILFTALVLSNQPLISNFVNLQAESILKINIYGIYFTCTSLCAGSSGTQY